MEFDETFWISRIMGSNVHILKQLGQLVRHDKLAFGIVVGTIGSG